MTGPATLNIFAPVPRILPSLWNSIAGDTTAFANPVIGTSVPAPAWRAILSNTPRAVNTAAITTRVQGTRLDTVFSSAPSDS